MNSHSCFVIRVSKKELQYATDMLRYDSTFDVTILPGSEEVVIKCLRFTPGRWKSFNAHPIVMAQLKTSQREQQGCFIQASSFYNALQLTQWLTGERMVE